MTRHRTARRPPRRTHTRRKPILRPGTHNRSLVHDALHRSCEQLAWLQARLILFRTDAQLVVSTDATGKRKIVVPCTPGMPDSFLLGPRGQCVWCEFKTGTGSPSPIQQTVHAYMRAMGQRVEIVRSLDQFAGILAELTA